MTEYRALRIAREMAARNEGRYFKDWIKRQSQKAGQSMTPLTDRERELVEACWDRERAKTREEIWAAETRILNALRAYDPPKARKYTMPTWVDLRVHAVKGDDVSMLIKASNGVAWVGRSDYEVLREALSTEEE